LNYSKNTIVKPDECGQTLNQQKTIKHFLDIKYKMYYSYIMYATDVEWDDVKNEANKREHEGLGFELAQLVFADPNRLERLDRSENNKSREERWQTLGMAGKVLFAVYTERSERKRIISARLANKAERRSYYGNYEVNGKDWSKAD
jgi:uncharacterized DUF497 family protein